jgi:hypothetical protein
MGMRKEGVIMFRKLAAIDEFELHWHDPYDFPLPKLPRIEYPNKYDPYDFNVKGPDCIYPE